MVDVSGHLIDTEGVGISGGVVVFTLVDNFLQQKFGGDQPRIPGTGVIFPQLNDSADSGAGGLFEISLFGNDVIAPPGTLYWVSYAYKSPPTPKIFYSISGSAFDLDTGTPAAAPAAPFVVATKLAVISEAQGDFTVSHGQGRVPVDAILTPTSNPGI